MLLLSVTHIVRKYARRGSEASFDEVQQLLKIVGEAPLYLKNERNNVIAFGFIKELSIIELNSLLYEADLELLL